MGQFKAPEMGQLFFASFANSMNTSLLILGTLPFKPKSIEIIFPSSKLNMASVSVNPD